MKTHLSEIERRVLAVIQEGLPGQLLAVLKGWEQEGKLRRLGAIVNHFQVGLGSGAMVVWQVDIERIEKVGSILAGFKEVSHAYERETRKNWPYNIYTMVHGANSKDVQRVVIEMSKLCGISDYRILSTEKELKKVAPTYIKEAETHNIKEEG
jgi:DNA-binding Lrp family transcriptional regulator